MYKVVLSNGGTPITLYLETWDHADAVYQSAMTKQSNVTRVTVFRRLHNGTWDAKLDGRRSPHIPPIPARVR